MFQAEDGIRDLVRSRGLGDVYKRQGKQDWLRSITMVWQNVEQFVVKKELAKTGTVEDLSLIHI